MNSPLLGVDIGFKRTGLALSEAGLLSRPLGVVETDLPHMAKAIQGIVTAAKEHEAATIVVGLPLSKNGLPTPQSERVLGVVGRLRIALAAASLDPEIETIDEYRSTVEAAALFPGAEPDAAAAALILQDYLETHE